jgi:ubiquinone/menaquinone biosynthesis C-methylase UbiE
MACPRDGRPLEHRHDRLICAEKHEYPLIDGIPIMLLDDVQQTLWVADASLDRTRENKGRDPYYVDTLGISESERVAVLRAIEGDKSGIDPVVRYIIAQTSGMLYRSLVGTLDTYPIPEIRLPKGSGQLLLDVGCNWGRWCIAGGQRGYRPIGIDPSLGAVLAARRVCKELNVAAHFVVGDARFLPFASQTFDVVFSYSVLQHFSKEDARKALDQIRRVLQDGGLSLVQMPNAYGVRCLYHQAKRGFREPRGFEVRYWSPSELLTAFTKLIGESTMSVDGFFGLGIQKSDQNILPFRYKMIIKASEGLRHLTDSLGFLTYLADSLYVQSTARKNAN